MTRFTVPSMKHIMNTNGSQERRRTVPSQGSGPVSKQRSEAEKFQLSFLSPSLVPRRDEHTLPSSYTLLKRLIDMSQCRFGKKNSRIH